MNTSKANKFKSVNKTTLAKAYGIPIRTLKLWLDPVESEIGEYLGKSFSPKQVETIILLLGEPEHIEMITIQ